MEKARFNELFQLFQKDIYDNKEHIPSFKFKQTHYLWLETINPLSAKGFWLSISFIINGLIIYYHFVTTSRIEQIAASASMLTLMLTIASRTPIINRITFILSSYTKCYMFHQVVYQLGMFHRFMAVSSFGWLIIHIANKPLVLPYVDDYLVICLSLLMSVILITSVKAFRTWRHDIFEHIHRYFSYFSLILLITYFHISNFQQAISLFDYLLKPEFYILLITAILSISPWIGVKKIKPILQHSGEHVAAFKIIGKPQYGSFTRITLGDCQFHSFGDSVFDVNDEHCFTLFITAAGDRTKAIVNAAKKGVNLIEQCFMRRDRSFGFMYHVAVYDTVLIVATGGGIAPVLPHIALNRHTKIIVLWFGHDQIHEFSNAFLLKLRHKISTDNVRIHMINSSLPWVKNMSINQTVQFTIQAYEHYQPEALFIVSNPTLTQLTLAACKQLHIKGYGATFDS